MSKSHRITPHRPPKDESRKQLADIKRENHQLKRALARAEKQVTRLVENSALVVEPESISPMDSGGVECPSCKGFLTTVTIGPKTLVACKNCGFRKVS
jgi:DNA-directed RNA polymerase subunit RPC12/RpoP